MRKDIARAEKLQEEVLEILKAAGPDGLRLEGLKIAISAATKYQLRRALLALRERGAVSSEGRARAARWSVARSGARSGAKKMAEPKPKPKAAAKIAASGGHLRKTRQENLEEFIAGPYTSDADLRETLVRYVERQQTLIRLVGELLEKLGG